MKAAKTPQQKKAYSYAKDRRNIYGESSEASRKGIRLHKRHVNQSYRTWIRTFLRNVGIVGSLTTAHEQDRLNHAEGRINSHQRVPWQKSPDISLSNYIAIKKERRLMRTNRRKPGLPTDQSAGEP